MIKQLKVIKMGINGEGIAYINKKPVFIDGCFPDEIVECDIKSLDFKYLKTKTLKIVKESKYRIKGEITSKKDVSCPLLDLDYDRQLFYKKEILKESLSKYSKIDVSIVKDVVRNEKIFNYRNQCKLPVRLLNNKLCTGLYEQNSNKFIKYNDYIVHDETLESVRKEALKILNKYNIKDFNNKDKKGLRYLVVRSLYGNTQITLVTGDEKLNTKMIDEIFKINSVVSIYQSINTTKNNIEIFGNKSLLLKGDEHLVFDFLGYNINLSFKSFFQLNVYQTEKLYKKVYDLIENCDFIVEAYCGVGIMSLMVSDKAKKVLGIENVKEAIINARKNCVNNNLSEKCEFICEDAYKKLNNIEEKIDYLIVDPPRSGLSEEMVNCILNKNIKNIIYVSCNSATLSKNLKELKKLYKIKTCVPFDMFSHTAHIETVALLSKLDVDKHINIKIELDELDLTSAESKATYEQIKEYVLNKFGFKVSTLYIAQTKRKCGIEVKEHYNKSKKENQRVPQCTPEKEEAIMDALRHFKMI